LNDLEVDDPSALNVGCVDDVRRSVSSMVPAAVGANDSSFFHHLAIFRGDLPGEFDDSRHNQDLSGVNCRRGERMQPDIQ
jgi:hypothetical protein